MCYEWFHVSVFTTVRCLSTTNHRTRTLEVHPRKTPIVRGENRPQINTRRGRRLHARLLFTFYFLLFCFVSKSQSEARGKKYQRSWTPNEEVRGEETTDRRERKQSRGMLGRLPRPGMPPLRTEMRSGPRRTSNSRRPSLSAPCLVAQIRRENGSQPPNRHDARRRRPGRETRDRFDPENQFPATSPPPPPRVCRIK